MRTTEKKIRMYKKQQHMGTVSATVLLTALEHMEISTVHDLPEYSQLHSSRSKVILNTPVGDA